MTQAKKHTSKRLVNFILAIVMIIGMVPATTITAFAASISYSMQYKEIRNKEGEDLFVRRDTEFGRNVWCMDWNVYGHNGFLENYDTDTANYVALNGKWYTKVYKEMVDGGVILGVRLNDGKFYMPTQPVDMKNGDGDKPGYISANDAMAISTLYFYGSPTIKGPGGGFLSYGGKDRSEIFGNGSLYLQKATGVASKYFSGISGNSITRGQAFVIIAACVEAYSGGTVKLENYSGKQFGYMKDPSDPTKKPQKCDWFTFAMSGGPAYQIHNSSGSWAVSDVGEVEGCSSTIVQATNLLIDAGVMHGRSDPSASVSGSWAGKGVEIAPNDRISYAEFLNMLFKVKNELDLSEHTPLKYLTLSKFTLNAHDDEISYRDFLDGGTATLRVDASANVDASGSVDYTFDVYENTYGVNGDESGRNASRTFRFDYSADDVDFTERVARNSNGEKTYSVKFYGRVEAALSDDDSVSDSKSDTDTGRINIVNYQPSTTFTATTNTLASPYNGWFY